MSFLKTFRNVLLASAIALSAISRGQAVTIVIGSADSQNGLPFDTVTSGIYQQIYSHSDFGSSPLSLTGVTFFGPSGASINAANYTVDVSTTTAPVGSSTLYQPGTDNTQEFSATLGFITTGGSYTIPFSNVFNYNPAQGNLLLQINIAGGPSNPGGLGFYTMSNGSGLFSRAANTFDGALNTNFTDSTGLVTQFNTPASPAAAEPGSLLMLGSALAAGGLFMRRRKAASRLCTK